MIPTFCRHTNCCTRMIIAALFVILAASSQGRADTLTLGAAADNTMYSEDGNQSNGAGNSFFAGRTNNAELRRALIRFDLSAIPPNSTVNSVTLTLYCSRERSGTENTSLHRLNASWGEGTSHAPGEEGSGAAATTNDVTWTYRFYNTSLWSASGGDFSGIVSATTAVAGQNAYYSWSSSGMVTDVQAWVDTPSSNHGWIIIGNETVDKTTKRFESRQSTTASYRPSLTINYTPPAGATGACCFGDGTCQVLTQANCNGQGGTYQGDGTSCSPNPCPQPTGACCFTNGSCQVLTQTECTSQGGTYQGNGTTCSPNPCPPPTGACCFANGSCQTLSQTNCAAQGGIYQGDATSCTPNPCPQPTGACCFGGPCQVLTQTDCTNQGGAYQGNGTSCTPDPCTGSQQVDLTSVLDNTLYQDAAGSLSNGKGIGFFAGTDNSMLIRRGVVAFDPTSIPAGATVTNAQLTLYLGYTQATASHDVTVHRALASWGEGTSDATGNESAGAASTAGDATWIHRFYNTTLWAAAGGDFASTASATTSVGTTTGFYTWSSSGLIADVQAWVASPATNFGWLLRCNETANRTQRRFDTREGTVAAQRPKLTVTYVVQEPTGACCFSDGSCQVLTQTNCATQSGTYQGDGTDCSPNPCPQPTGACCFADGSCQALTQTECSSQGGSYQGNGTNCSPNPCPQPTGACCFTDGSCQVLTQTNCTSQGGVYQGSGSGCSPNPCPPPTGACCFGDGSCQVVTQANCAAQGGTYQGNSTGCSPNPCPQPTGACCLNSGVCLVETAVNCTAQGGAYQGDNTPCTTDLCPVILTPFVDPLPIPAVAQPLSGIPGGTASYEIPIQQVQQQLHSDLPPTTVWGYGGTYPGLTIVASVDHPVTVTWINDLRDEFGNLRTTHYMPVDLCVMGAADEAKVVVHLHGGHVPKAADGYPEDTFLPGFSATYVYPNKQLPATLWYHDHALGITRLNVIMGLAGFYLLFDDFETSLNLPSGSYEIGLAIQDRTFNSDGSFRYPAMWEEDFLGDKILVNGKVWPYLNVAQGKYRFRLLGGSTTRTYTLSLSNGAAITQIGTEGGLLPAPVALSSITIAPGERADVIVDFEPYAAGTEILLLNSAPAPFPGPPGEGVIPNVMKFIVQNQSGHTAPLPSMLRPVTPLDPADATTVRDLELKKISDPCTGSRWAINGLGWDTITEYPMLGTTEIWRFINRSGMSHPMHMHLVMFQLLDRQNYEIVDGQVVPVGDPILPPPNEAGWKDTVMCHPGQITRVICRFENFVGRYPYHCHILEHEEHEMMRQFEAKCRKGDTNQDTLVDGRDIALFVNELTASAGPGTAAYCAADMDDNGVLNMDAEVPPFVDCLLNEVCP